MNETPLHVFYLTLYCIKGNVNIYMPYFLSHRNTMMDMEQPTMTRDMTHMTTTTTIRHRSKFVCVCVFCGGWSIWVCCLCKGHLSERMWSYIWKREFIHNVGQCSPLCIEPKSLCRSSQSWTWRFAVLEIVQANVGGSSESPKERSVRLANESLLYLAFFSAMKHLVLYVRVSCHCVPVKTL